MKILVSKNKRLYIEDKFIVEGENKADKLEFEFPSELENYIKFIVISSDEGKYIDLIIDNEYIITKAISNLHNISIAVICTNSEIVNSLTKVEDLTDIENDIEFRSLSIELPTMDFLVDLDTVENDNNPSAIARVYKKVLKNTEDINTIKENQDNLNQNFNNVQSNVEAINESNNKLIEKTNTLETSVNSNSDKIQSINENLETKSDKASTATDIEVSLNQEDYKLKIFLKNNDGQVLSEKEVDFPIESMIVNATYNKETKEIEMTLQNENKIKFRIGDLVSGLISQTDLDTELENLKIEIKRELIENVNSEINTNYQQKTEAFNQNASDKTTEFNTNSDLKENEFNMNALQKTNEFNQNAESYRNDIDSLKQQCDELSKNMSFNSIEGESINIDDAYTYNKNSLKIYGNIKQTPVPDPTSLSEIRTVKENIHFYKCSKNQFNFNKIQTVNTVSKNENGSFESSKPANLILIGVNFESVPFSGLKLAKDNYYLQFKIKTNANVTLNNLFICTRNKEDVANNIGKSINKEIKANTETIIETKFELTELKEKVGIVAYLSSSVDFTVYDVMICKDINDTKFEECKENDYTLAVQKEMFTGDYFTKDEEVHCWKKHEFIGTEAGFSMQEYETSLKNVYSFRMHLGSGLIKGMKVCSNYFEEKEVLFNKDITGMKCAENASIDFHIHKELLEDGTIQSFKAWLKQKHDEGNPVIVYYKSEEEEKLLLTEEQKTVINNLYNKFELIEGINHIYSDDEVSPIFSLNYMQSNKILNQKMNEKIKNIESRLSLLE